MGTGRVGVGGVGGSGPGARRVFVWEVGGWRGGEGVSRHLQVMTPYLLLTTQILFYISPQECEISVPILSRSALPRSCTKFAFPRARVPKMSGTLERRNAGTQERGSAGTRNQERAPTSDIVTLSLFRILVVQEILILYIDFAFQISFFLFVRI